MVLSWDAHTLQRNEKVRDDAEQQLHLWATKSWKNFNDAGVKLVTLSNYTELIHLAEQEGYINAEGLALLKRFKEDWKKIGD